MTSFGAGKSARVAWVGLGSVKHVADWWKLGDRDGVTGTSNQKKQNLGRGAGCEEQEKGKKQGATNQGKRKKYCVKETRKIERGEGKRVNGLE